MEGETVPAWRRRSAWCALLAAAVLLPVLIAPPVALILAIPAVIVMIVAIMHWPFRAVTFAQGATAAAVVSLVVDAGYPGPGGLVLLWLPIELAALTVLLGRVVRRVPGRSVLGVGATVLAAVLLLGLRLTLRMSPPGWAESVVFAALAFIPAACAVGVGWYLRSLDLQRVRAVVEARRNQRLRVAGDLHDFVAHEVTGIVVEAQAGQVATDDPEQLRELLARIEEAGMRALDSMDHTVRTLRDPVGGEEDPPARAYGLADLPELVGRFSATGPAHVGLDLPAGVADALSPAVDGACYALVLEALTNIRRHAPGATRVAVAVARIPGDAIEVTVTDDGGVGGLSVGRVSGGTGLAGLGDRLRSLGCELSAGPYEEGWRVRCVLPAAAAARPTGSIRWPWRSLRAPIV